MIRITTLTLLLAMLFSSCRKSMDPQIIAHRGYWKTEGSAQNSVKALESADRIAVYGSEFDVHITADDVPVVTHDNTLNGFVIQMTNFEFLSDAVLSNGEILPTLEDYLHKGKDLKIKLILEVKPHYDLEREHKAAQVIVDMVKKSGLENKVEYITFSMEIGKELIRLSPEAEVAFLYSSGDHYKAPEELKSMGFTGIDYHHSVFLNKPEIVSQAKKLGMSVNVWTVNDLEKAQQLIDMGVEYITTDIPEEIQALIKNI